MNLSFDLLDLLYLIMYVLIYILGRSIGYEKGYKKYMTKVKDALDAVKMNNNKPQWGSDEFLSIIEEQHKAMNGNNKHE